MTSSKYNGIKDIHHVAIIFKDYQRSKTFYTEILGFSVIQETYRSERQSYKCDLGVSPESRAQIELFSFPNPPSRPSRPEAAGARHLCFAVDNLDVFMKEVIERAEKGVAREGEGEGGKVEGWVEFEDVRVDEITGERFVFMADPDGLPIEFKEVGGREGW